MTVLSKPAPPGSKLRTYVQREIRKCDSVLKSSVKELDTAIFTSAKKFYVDFEDFKTLDKYEDSILHLFLRARVNSEDVSLEELQFLGHIVDYGIISESKSSCDKCAGEEFPDKALSLLVSACEKHSYLPVVEMLLNARTNPNKCHKSQSPLMQACKYGMSETISLLLKHKDIQINLTNENNDTALHLACSNHQWESVDILLQHGADPFITNKQGDSPANILLSAKQSSLVDSISSSSDKHLQWFMQRVSLLQACSAGYCSIAAEHLKSQPPESEMIIHSCKKNGVVLLDMLLSHKDCSHVNLKHLIACIENDTVDCFDRILQKVDVKVLTPSNVTMLIEKCISTSHYECLVPLVAYCVCHTESNISSCFTQSHIQQIEQISVVHRILESNPSLKEKVGIEDLLPQKLTDEHAAVIDLILQNKIKSFPKSCLIDCCLLGLSECIKVFLKHRKQMSDDECNDTPVTATCSSGSLETLKLIVESNKFDSIINQPNTLGKSPLQISVEKNHLNICLYLLDNGAKVSINNSTLIPLLSACSNDTFLNTLLAKVPSSSDMSLDWVRHLPLQTLLMVEDPNLIKAYIHYKGKELQKSDYVKLLLRLCKKNLYLSFETLVSLETENKIDFATVEACMRTACEYGSKYIVEFLLSKFPKLANDVASLSRAVSKNREGIIQFMIPRITIETAQKLLIEACQRNLANLVKMLVHRVQTSNFHIDGQSPVGIACKMGFSKVLKILIECEANLETPDFGKSPLLAACECPSVECAQMIIAKGVDCDSCDTDNNRPLSIACINGHYGLLFILLNGPQTKADPDLCSTYDQQQNTALRYSIHKGDIEMITLLLESGSNPNSRVHSQDNYKRKFDENVTTQAPLQLAHQLGHHEQARLLLEFGADPKTIRQLSLQESCNLGYYELALQQLDPLNKEMCLEAVCCATEGAHYIVAYELMFISSHDHGCEFLTQLKDNLNTKEFKWITGNSFLEELKVKLEKKHLGWMMKRLEQVIKDEQAQRLPRLETQTVETDYDPIKETPEAHSLWAAFNQRNHKRFKELLQKGKSPNEKNKQGEPLLHLCIHSAPTFVKTLVETEAVGANLDIEAKNNDDETAIFEAVESDYMIVSSSADIQNKQTLFSYLVRAHARANVRNIFGQTILHTWKPRCDGLTDKRCDELHTKFQEIHKHVGLDEVDFNGQTALHLAVLYKNSIYVEWLLNAGANTTIQDKASLTPLHYAMMQKDIASKFQGYISKAHFYMHFETLKMWEGHNTESCLDNLWIEQSDYAGGKFSLVESLHCHDLTEYICKEKQAIQQTKTSLTDKFMKDYLPKLICCEDSDGLKEARESVGLVLNEVMKDVSRLISKKHPYLAFTPKLSGSTREGTKVHEANEIDMLCIFDTSVIPHPFTQNEWTFVKLQCPDSKFEKLCEKATNFLNGRKIIQLFYKEVRHALAKVLPKYKSLFMIVTKTISETDCTINHLKLVWQGKHLLWQEFDADVVPAFLVDDKYLPGVIKHEHLVTHVVAVPKWTITLVLFDNDHLAFQFGFTNTENYLFQHAHPTLKQGFMLTKLIKSLLPEIDERPIEISSYHLKTSTLQTFTESESFKEVQKPNGPTEVKIFPVSEVTSVPNVTKSAISIFKYLESALLCSPPNLESVILSGYNLLDLEVYKRHAYPLLYLRLAIAKLSEPSSPAWADLAGTLAQIVISHGSSGAENFIVKADHLFEIGLDIDFRLTDKTTLLGAMVKENCCKGVELLLERGASLDDGDGNGSSAIRMSVMEMKEECINLFKEKKCNYIPSYTVYESTPLRTKQLLNSKQVLVSGCQNHRST